MNPVAGARRGSWRECRRYRTAIGQGGSQHVERLQAAAPAKRRYRHITEHTTIPVAKYVAELHAYPADNETGSVVRWSADFDVVSGDEQQAVDMIQGFLSAGLDNLKERYK